MKKNKGKEQKGEGKRTGKRSGKNYKGKGQKEGRAGLRTGNEQE